MRGSFYTLYRKSRADISALLLISFLYQIVTPIVVLAGSAQDDSAFETALRNSICRVQPIARGDDPVAGLTDNFIPDWCVLHCAVEQPSLVSILPDARLLSFEDARPQSFVLSHQLNTYDRGMLRALYPRAPPIFG